MPGENRNIIFISSLENNHLLKNLDFEVAKEEAEEIEMVAELAKRCRNSGVKRPSLKYLMSYLG
jgi:hypothetical protein